MHHILCWTILLLFIPVYELLWGPKARIPTPVEWLLIYLILQTIFLSILFWWNPVRHSWMHRIDVWNARIVIVVSIIYTLGFKMIDVNDRVLYICICAILAWAFYFSYRHSSQSWCSQLHIMHHVIFHIMGALMTILTIS